MILFIVPNAKTESALPEPLPGLVNGESQCPSAQDTLGDTNLKVAISLFTKYTVSQKQLALYT